MSVRRVLVALGAVLALLSLSACQPKVGTAAYVGDHRITEDTVNSSVRGLTEQEAAAANVDVKSQVGGVRALVLQYMIRVQLMDRALDANGGPATNEELEAKHDDALSQIFGSSTGPTGSDGDAALVQAVVAIGADASFAKTILQSWQKELVLADRSGAASDTDIATLITKLGIKLKVNPRYGTWDAVQLTLTNDQLPDYLDLSSMQTSATDAPAAN